MCLQDIAIGRRTQCRLNTYSLGISPSLIAAANPDRIGLSVSGSMLPGNISLYAHGVGGVLRQFAQLVYQDAFLNDLAYWLDRYYSIRDYGLLVCGEIYASGSGGPDLYVGEYIMLPDVGAAVKKEVDRAF